MSNQNPVERGFERLLVASRWLMAPMYLGLVVALAMLGVVFLREFFHYAPDVMSMKGEIVILVVLTLIDLTLAANLLAIELFSGYRKFVPKFDFDAGTDRPDGMGKVDFSALKMKSIVAISAIDLLKRFMSIEEITDPAEMDRKFI